MTEPEPDAIELLASLTGWHADTLAETPDARLAAERQRSLDLAEALVVLVDGLDSIPDHSRSVAVETLLDAAGEVYQHALDGLRGEWFEVPGAGPSPRQTRLGREDE